jgi:hypothetical protein
MMQNVPVKSALALYHAYLHPDYSLSSLSKQLDSFGIDPSVRDAVLRAINHQNNHLDFDSFCEALEAGIIPASKRSVPNIRSALTELVYAFTTLEHFVQQGVLVISKDAMIEYLQSKFGLSYVQSVLIARECNIDTDESDVISSIQYMKMVLRGFVPNNRDKVCNFLFILILFFFFCFFCFFSFANVFCVNIQSQVHAISLSENFVSIVKHAINFNVQAKVLKEAGDIFLGVREFKTYHTTPQALVSWIRKTYPSMAAENAQVLVQIVSTRSKSQNIRFIDFLWAYKHGIIKAEGLEARIQHVRLAS